MKTFRVLAWPSDTPPASTPCRSCGAPLVWAETLAGKRMPVNADLAADPLEETRDERGRLVLVFDAEASHFATCPASSAWSGRRRA